MAKFRKNKGVALMIALLVLLFLSILSSAAFIRYVGEQGTSQREKALVQAFYSAEEGLNYAYAELKQRDFSWNTHTWNNYGYGDVLTPAKVSSPCSDCLANAAFDAQGAYYINDAANPHYFKVITYPELDTAGIPTGVTVVHSQGADSKQIATRTLELRVAKTSMFDYFYFFPSDRTFSGATYDGAGYGKIHVNGAVTFSSGPNFTNIVGLSTADSAHNGYYYLYNSQYGPPYSYDNNSPYSAIDGVASLLKSGSPPYDYYLPGDMYYLQNKFSTNATVDGIAMPKELTQPWSWDKYSGDKSASEVPTAFKIDNASLAWLTYKKGDGAILSGTDYQNFINSPSTFDWEAWKTNNGYTAPDVDTTGSLARKFWEAWLGANPSNINSEWWSDLTYGNDRSAGDIVSVDFFNTKEQSGDWQEWAYDKDATITAADSGATTTKRLSEVIKDSSSGGTYLTPIGLDNNSYITKAQDGGLLMTKGLSNAFLAWLNAPQQFTYNDKTITFTMAEAARITGVLGGYSCAYNMGWTIPTCQANWPEDVSGSYGALNTYITQRCATKPTGEDVYDWNTTLSDLEAAQVVSFTEFYNQLHPAGVSSSSSPYNETNLKKTRVMEIDVAKLRTYLQGKSFNGIIYIDNADYKDYYYTQADFSVLVKNAGVLPENGLTIVTPHNIYVQGSFNLDYSRDGATQAYTAYKDKYGGADTEYQWRPAALISSKRAIYTVSDDFETFIKNINNFADIKPYKYWDSFNTNSWPYCLTNQTFLDTYFNSGLVSMPPEVTAFLAKYSLSAPGTWTPADIQAIFDSAKYPDAGAAQQALLNAGETKYETDNETGMPNRVSSDVIYNTAVVTPYDPQGYTLERWVDTGGNRKKRQITGAFIQLEETKRTLIPCSYQVIIYDENGKETKRYYEIKYGPTKRTCYSTDGHCINGYFDTGGVFHSPTYSSGYYAKGSYPPYYNDPWFNPTQNYAYETNLKTTSGGSSSLSASGVVSWLEIPNNDFCPKCQ